MEPLNNKTDAPHAALSSYVMCRCDVLKGTCERLAEVFDRIKDENEMMVSSFAAIWDKSCAATGESALEDQRVHRSMNCVQSSLACAALYANCIC